MAIVTYGEWAINVDAERMKALYNTTSDNNSQGYRNFKKYCESMPENEKAFFERFGINPLNCRNDCYINADKSTVIMHGCYFISGEFKCAPKQITADKKYIYQEDFEGTEIAIGKFYFMFQHHDSPYCYTPSNLPKDCISVQFTCEIPWLLNEKSEYSSLTNSFWGKILWHFQKNKKFEGYNSEYSKKVNELLLKIFKENGIKFEVLDEEFLTSYKKEWLNAFSPKRHNNKIKKACYKNKHFVTYLWHLFSYEFAKSVPCEEARKEYDSTAKSTAIVMLERERLCYRIENFSSLTTEILDKIQSKHRHYIDVIITADDFSWTYCMTHEGDYCGPFFYKKQQ